MENQTITTEKEIKRKRAIVFIRFLKEYNCYIEAMEGFEICRKENMTIANDFFIWLMKIPRWSYIYWLSVCCDKLKIPYYQEKWIEDLSQKYYMYLKSERK